MKCWPCEIGNLADANYNPVGASTPLGTDPHITRTRAVFRGNSFWEPLRWALKHKLRDAI